MARPPSMHRRNKAGHDRRHLKEKAETQFGGWIKPNKFIDIGHEPFGPNKLPSALYRGPRQFQTKVGLYDSPFMKLAVKMMAVHVQSGGDFALPAGCRPPFTMT